MTALPQLKSQLDQANSKIRSYETQIKSEQNKVAELKQLSKAKHDEISQIERDLLEAGFELSEL